jgi:predicted GNAT superfamily acetyltransferase
MAGIRTEYEVEVVELTTAAECRRAAGLLDSVWQVTGTGRVVDPELMRALAFAGNYVAGAWLDDRLVGVSVAFRGAESDLHSHVTGVARKARGRQVGLALKLHQRDWALARGLDTIRWTFDPLVRRNAYFNVHKLGARVATYLPDFYGTMTDGVNAVPGDASDRLLAVWELRGADRPARRAPGEVDVHHVPMPDDIEALRTTDPAAAVRWRYEVRSALTSAFDEGYAVTDVTRDGYYVLERG